MMVCIEGVDASGKATQSARLAARMSAKLFSFPAYDTLMGKLIKGHLLRYWEARPTEGEMGEGLLANPPEGAVHSLNAKVFQALQLANRMELACALDAERRRGGDVVLDRYWPSGYAYGKADGFDGDYLIGLHRWLPQPDLFILLDIDPKESVRRRPERRDRYEKQPGLMEAVTSIYRELWGKMQQGEWDWVTVDGNEDEDTVADHIWRVVRANRGNL